MGDMVEVNKKETYASYLVAERAPWALISMESIHGETIGE